MNEEVFTLAVEDGLIHGILHKPAQHSNGNNQKIIVFLHGWAGYRVGPHDMFVKLARKLTLIGYHCLRFDFRGRGFSHDQTNLFSNASMLTDLECILDYVTKDLRINRINLLGICSGAKLALYYAHSGTKTIENVIDLSSSLLKNAENNKLQIEKTKSTFKEYFSKVFYSETWYKFFSGTLNYSKIVKNVFGFVQRFHGPKLKHPKMNVSILSSRKKQVQPFSNLKGSVLSIHGEKDPETKIAISQISELLKQYKINFEMHVIKGANHSFYGLNWEAEIYDIVIRWLTKSANNAAS